LTEDKVNAAAISFKCYIPSSGTGCQLACLTLHHAHVTVYNPSVPMYHRVNVSRRHNVRMILL
jgi:hypothetical protein